MKQFLLPIPVITLFLIVLMALSACQKSANVVYVAPDSIYSGRLQFVLRYNTGQDSLFYKLLVKAGLADTLSTPGPFTVFVPVNAAIENLSFVIDPSIYLLSGEFHLAQIPPGATQVLTTAGGYKIFISSYVTGTDTTYTANGSLVHAADQPASNGLAQVLQAPFFPGYFPTCLYYINSSQDYSVFAYAIKHSHLDVLLNDSTAAYSVLAPNNNAMSNAGYSLDSLSREDPDTLAGFVENHIIPGRRYLYDYVYPYLGTTQADTFSVLALNGNAVQVIVNPKWLTDPIDYPVQFFMPGTFNYYPHQPASTHFYNPFDVPAGMGTVQEIDAVLTP